MDQQASSFGSCLFDYTLDRFRAFKATLLRVRMSPVMLFYLVKNNMLDLAVYNSIILQGLPSDSTSVSYIGERMVLMSADARGRSASTAGPSNDIASMFHHKGGELQPVANILAVSALRYDVKDFPIGASEQKKLSHAYRAIQNWIRPTDAAEHSLREEAARSLAVLDFDEGDRATLQSIFNSRTSQDFKDVIALATAHHRRPINQSALSDSDSDDGSTNDSVTASRRPAQVRGDLDPDLDTDDEFGLDL